MPKGEPTRPPSVPQPESSPSPILPEQEEHKTKDFTEIGGAPVPGFTLRYVLRGHKSTINRIRWSPDGSYLASPSHDKTIRIWDSRSEACVHTLQGHANEVLSVAWSPDGQRLASASYDNTIHLWDRIHGKDLQILQGHTEKVFGIAWSPDGKRLASGSIDSQALGNDSRENTIRLWDAVGGKCLQMLKGNSVTNVEWSPNSKPHVH